RELARMRSGVLTFTAPADASYRLRFNELMYRTGDDYGFRITLSPAALQAPRTVGLPAVRPIQIGQTVQDCFLPQGQSQAFDLPFMAGEKFIIEVHSHQLGHATDPHLVIENLKPDGKLTPQVEVADAPAITPVPDISIPSRDPSYAYVAKADGAFRITVSDNFATTQPYELRIVKETPTPAPLIALNAILPGAKVKGAEMGSANVPRGGIAALEIIAPNRNTLSEPIELKADKLPRGVTCLGGFIGKGQSLGYIAFQASADAPAGASILSGIPQSRFVSFGVADATKDNILYRTTGAPALGVSSQPAPAFVQTEKTDILEVAADAKLEIALKVTRHADFTEALKLKALGLVDATKAPEADIPAKATMGKFTLDVKALKLAPGDYGFILQGPAKMKFRRGVEELNAADTDAKKAVEAQAVAKKQLDTANADTTPKKAELVKVATAALKTADTTKATADKLVKDLAAKFPAKEATFIVYCNPIRIRVKEVAKK
ncbi:MAG: peptidase domain protein, partial [Prosthecobacter sp.]|nr:peptidase domain protein [Prosthecobacter sp.]